jgi:pimeloyl-ACP methyl ester carboxylesterase
LLVLVSPLISHLEVIWEEPALEHLISRLAVCSRVVLFDRRGIGLSDRSPGLGEVAGLPRLAADAAAVLDSCGTRAAVLMGVTFGAQLAVQFAADYPDRTQALIRVGGWAKLTRILQFDFEADPGQIDAWVDAAARGWGTGAVLAAHAAAMRDSARYREWAARVERNTSSPGTVAAMLRWAARVDVRPLLGRLRAPCWCFTARMTGRCRSSTAHSWPSTSPVPPSSRCPVRRTRSSWVISVRSSTRWSGSWIVRSPTERCGRRCGGRIAGTRRRADGGA